MAQVYKAWSNMPRVSPAIAAARRVESRQRTMRRALDMSMGEPFVAVLSSQAMAELHDRLHLRVSLSGPCEMVIMTDEERLEYGPPQPNGRTPLETVAWWLHQWPYANIDEVCRRFRWKSRHFLELYFNQLGTTYSDFRAAHGLPDLRTARREDSR